MKTLTGAQRVSDYRCFNRNMGLFLREKVQNMREYAQWRSFCQTEPIKSYLKYQGSYYRSKKQKLEGMYRSYLGFWERNLKIL
jgi:hypothetical protein